MTREEWNEYHRKYREKHREKLKEYNRKYWQWYKAIRRKRYKNDPEYRAKELERKAKERIKNDTERNQRIERENGR